MKLAQLKLQFSLSKIQSFLTLNLKAMSDAVEPNTYYTIQDPSNNYLTCDANGNLSLSPTEDTTAGPNTQWWQTGATAPAQTVLTNQAGGGSNLLYCDGIDNSDLTTGAMNTWSIDTDGSFTSDTLESLYATSNASTMKAVASKTKQTWTWNKKVLKGGAHY